MILSTRGQGRLWPTGERRKELAAEGTAAEEEAGAIVVKAAVREAARAAPRDAVQLSLPAQSITRQHQKGKNQMLNDQSHPIGIK